jgi:hypothetical protein
MIENGKFTEPVANQRERQPKPWMSAELMFGAGIAGQTYGEGLKAVYQEMTRTGRKVVVEGDQNLPQSGNYILAANHYARANNTKEMTGPQKENDLFASQGLLQKLAEKREGAKVMHLIRTKPRPELPIPKNDPIEAAKTWLINKMKNVPTNKIRDIFIDLFKKDENLVVVPYVPETMVGMRELVTRIKEHLKTKESDEGKEVSGNNSVLVIFPEGEATHELKDAKQGIGHLATNLYTPVVPVAIFDDNGTLRVTIGKPFTAPREMNYMEATDTIMSRIAEMLPVGLRGKYKEEASQTSLAGK